MGLLEKGRNKVDGLKAGAAYAKETLSIALRLIRERTREKTELAMLREGAMVSELNTDPVDFLGTSLRQEDADTMCIDEKEFRREDLLAAPRAPMSIQHNLNANFLPFGWSCTIGSGPDALRVSAYGGRNGKSLEGVKILVVKTLDDRILNIIKVDTQIVLISPDVKNIRGKVKLRLVKATEEDSGDDPKDQSQAS